MDRDMSLQTVDYVVTGVMLLIPLGIGVLFAVKDSKKATRDEYLLGGRRMAMLPVTLSLFVTFMSAIGLMGTPTDIYTYGAMFSTVHLGFGISYIIGFYTMIPLIYPLHLTSVYEYLQLRFDSELLRMSAVVVGMLQTTCYMAIALLTPALGLQAAGGIPLWMSVAIVGVIGTVYTAIGGIKSVVWTDAFQCFVMYFGVICIIVKGILEVGGPGQVLAIAEAGGRTDFSAISPDPRVRHSWWGTIIGGMFMWLVNMFNQSTTQRISAMKTMRDAKMSCLLNIPILVSYGALLFAVGIVIFAYFSFIRCDPFEAGFITNRNQLPPFFVLHVLSDMPGMPGLYMATLFSAALSTISSGINALAANTVEDILRRPLRNVKESTATFITKLTVCAYGVFIIGLAYAANSLKGPLTQMALSVFGACGGPILGVFFLSGFVPWANKYSVFSGGCLALAINLWMAVGNQLYGRKVRTLPHPPLDNCFTNSTLIPDVTDALTLQNTTLIMSTSAEIVANDAVKDRYSFGFFPYDISYEWYGFIGTLISFFGGLLFSYCTRNYVTSKVDPKLIFPIARKFWSLPEPPHIGADESNIEAIENLKMSHLKVQEFKQKEFLFVVNDNHKDPEEEQIGK